MSLPERLRLAELAGSLSLATDLGNGQPLETALGCTVAAMALADALDLDPAQREAVFWGGLLRFVGCTSTSVEESSFGGDDIDLRAALIPVDFGDPPDLAARLARTFARELPSAEQARRVAEFLDRGPKIAPQVLRAHCEVAVRLASRLGLSEAVTQTLDAYHERWDGHGPKGLAAEMAPIAARVLSVAQVFVSHARLASPAEVVEVLRRRAGGQLDPQVVRAALDLDLARSLGAPGAAWDRMLELEPRPWREVGPQELPAVARVLGDYADLKSPFTLGHSQGVSRLAAAAARSLGLPEADVRELELAGSLHDLGRVSVPNGIWDKPGPLNAMERDRVERHAYETERILAMSPLLAPIARLASSEHERIDGGGYPRGLGGPAISGAARILVAADAYHGALEARAFRPAAPPAKAAKELRAEAKEGRLDARAVEAVLEAAGVGAPKVGSRWPAGLTEREVEVLRWIARGLTNKEIAAQLAISPRTVQQHSINVYGKIGVSTRAAATLFAAEHQLFAVW